MLAATVAPRSTPARRQRHGSRVHLGTADAAGAFRSRAASAPANPQWTPGVEALNQFSDGFPWLLISEASLEDLNGACRAAADEPLPPEYRRQTACRRSAKIVVHELAGGGVRLRRVKPCTRCIVTTTDQSTGTRDGDEPLRTLAQFRFDRELKGVVFGQNLILIDGLGARAARRQTNWKSIGD